MTRIIKNSSISANNYKVLLIKKKNPIFSGRKVSINSLRGFEWVHFMHDPIFNDFLFSKFVNSFIKKGDKDKVYKIFYSLFGRSYKKKIPFFLFSLMVERLKPAAYCVRINKERKSTIKGVYTTTPATKVPIAITEARAYRIAVQFLYKAVIARKNEHSLEKKVFAEFEAFFKESGYVNPF